MQSGKLKMSLNNQIEAYTDPSRPVKYMEEFLIRKIEPFFTLKSCQSQMKVLDIGCGDGLLSKMLAKNNPEHVFEASDISEKLISIAQSRSITANLKYKVNDCRNCEPAYADIIIASGVLSIFQDWEDVLEKWLNSLKSNGNLFIFGGFNPEDIDLRVSFRNNYNNSDWQGGLSAIAIPTLEKYIFRRKHLNITNLGEFIPPAPLPKSKNPIRGYTVDEVNGRRFVVNGALQIRRFFLFCISSK